MSSASFIGPRPVELACVVKADYTPNTSQQSPNPSIKVQSNEVGYVGAEKAGWSYITVHHHGIKRTGWVPSAVIQKGNTRAAPLLIQEPNIPPPTSPAPAPSPSDDIVLKTITEFWSMIKKHPTTAVRVAERSERTVTRVLYGPGLDHYASILHRCMVPEARDFIVQKNGHFDPRELINRMEGIDKTKHNSENCFGTYIIGFFDIAGIFIAERDNKWARDALYGGQTLDFPDRERGHEYDLKKPSNRPAMLYKIGSTASMHKMAPLFVFNHDDPDVVRFGKQIILEAAELTTVCLFRSWQPKLYKSEPVQGAGGFDILAYAYAKIYNELMAKVEKKTGWNPRPTVGLNKKTPALCQDRHERQWIQYFSPDVGSFFFRWRCSVSVYTKHKKHYVVWRNPDFQITIPESVQKVANFCHGDTVVLQIEIANDGNQYRTHPQQYVRIPTPCHNQEIEKLKSMGMRLQWFDKKQRRWLSSLLQITQVKHRSQNEYSNIIQGMHLFAAMTQLTYRGAPNWMRPLDRTTIVKVDYDHLRQTAALRGLPTVGTLKNWPRNWTMEENVGRIEQLIPPHMKPKVTIGRKPARMMPSHRSRCDLCISTADVSSPSSPSSLRQLY
jgi:hypothetical protein